MALKTRKKRIKAPAISPRRKAKWQALIFWPQRCRGYPAQASPEHRREYARKAIERIMQRFYGEPEERIRPIVSVVLDALERDEYWQVLERINAARHEDVGVLLKRSTHSAFWS